MWGVLISILYFALGFVRNYSAESRAANQAVLEINALRQHMAAGRLEEANQSLDRVENFVQAFRGQPVAERLDDLAELIPLGLLLLCLGIFLFFIYRKFLKPFEDLEDFAENVARGNWDLPLKYRKDDYFGKFTWAFDNMRNELKHSKERESEAIESNQVVISTLSHDIKTPVATIRAYAEVLGKKLPAHDEKNRRYADVIVQKSDEIAKRTDDLFVHTISMMNPWMCNRSLWLWPRNCARCSASMNFPVWNCVIWMSLGGRTSGSRSVSFEQVVENIMRNAEKYAPVRLTSDCIKPRIRSGLCFAITDRVLRTGTFPLFLISFIGARTRGRLKGQPGPLYRS